MGWALLTLSCGTGTVRPVSCEAWYLKVVQAGDEVWDSTMQLQW